MVALFSVSARAGTVDFLRSNGTTSLKSLEILPARLLLNNLLEYVFVADMQIIFAL